MALNITNTKKEISLIPEGTHVGILYSIVDLGTQEVQFKGETKYQPKVRLTFELPNETKEFDGVVKPLVIGGKYTMSLSDKAILKPIIEGILGKKLTDAEKANFSSDEFHKLMGKPVMLNVMHTVSQANGNTYANIASVSPLMKGLTVPNQFNENVIYDVSEGQTGAFESLPEFVREDIMKSVEMRPLSSDSSEKIAEARGNVYPQSEESLSIRSVEKDEDYSEIPF